MTESTTYDARWAIRGLYLSAIALNVWYLYQVMSDSDEGLAVLDQIETRLRHYGRLWHQRIFFRDHADDTIRQAEQIVERETDHE